MRRAVWHHGHGGAGLDLREHRCRTKKRNFKFSGGNSTTTGFSAPTYSPCRYKVSCTAASAGANCCFWSKFHRARSSAARWEATTACAARMASSRPPSRAVARSGGQLRHLRLLGVALGARLIQFLPGNDVRSAELFTPRQFRRGQFQFRLRPFQLRAGRCDFRGPPAFEEVVQFRLRLREVFIRLLQRGGLRLAVQPEEQLPGLDRAAPGHGQIGERASQRRGDIDIFALDVALKGDGGIFRRNRRAARGLIRRQ